MKQRQQKRKSNTINPLYKLKLTQRTSWFLHEPGSPRCKTALSPIHVDECRCRCRNSHLHMEDCRHPQVNLFRDLSRVASILFPSISSWVFKSHDKKIFSMTPFVTKVPHLFFVMSSYCLSHWCCEALHFRFPFYPINLRVWFIQFAWFYHFLHHNDFNFPYSDIHSYLLLDTQNWHNSDLLDNPDKPIRPIM